MRLSPFMPVNTPHKSYTASLPKWQRCRDVHDGSDAVKARREQYLPKLDGHDDVNRKYDAYLLRALFYNGMGRTVQGLTGAVFRKDPAVDVPTVIEPNLDDITLSRVPFNAFALETLEEVIKVGRYGVLVDFSDTKNRPYWVPYLTERVTNWKTVNVGGEAVLTRVVLKECVHEQDPIDGFAEKEVEQYRVLELIVGPDRSAQLATPDTLQTARYRITKWRKKVAPGSSVVPATVAGDQWEVRGDPVFPKRRGESLSFIPFVFFGPSSLAPDVQKPPLLDLADVNLSHFRSSADHEHGLHYCGLPQPWASGVDPTSTLKIGSGVAWLMKDPQARAGYLEFTGQGLEPLEKALAGKEAKMATLGARLLEAPSGQAATATEIEIRHGGEHATLKTTAGTVQMGLERLLVYHAFWMGATATIEESEKDVEVELNGEFFAVKMTPEELKAQMLLWQSGGVSFDTFYWNLTRGGVTRPGVTQEAERQLIDAENATRQVEAQALIDNNPDPNNPGPSNV